MKVFYNGFNLYRQFPKSAPLVEKFSDEIIENLRDVEVNHTFSVLLVANYLIFSGAKNKRLTLKPDWEISKIASNEDLVLVLLKNGDILKIAQNESLKSNFIKLPKLADLDEGDHAIHIAAGAKLSVALTKNGNIYNIPNKLNFQNHDIIDLKSGREHCVILCKNGDIYTFGRGSRGQLGHGSLEDEMEPKFVDALGGIKIVAISAEGWHSCALSKDGDMYIWGWNGNGQIGLSPNENLNDDAVSVMAVPHLIEFDLNVKMIGCGNRHTIALLENGHLFGCGWNKYKQLKDDTRENFYRMTYLHDFSQETVNEIKCGPWNTLVLCADT